MASFSFKPLGDRDDPFRKNLGERYFNKGLATLGLMLWLLASGLTRFYGSHFEDIGGLLGLEWLSKLGRWIDQHNSMSQAIGGFFAGVYFVRAVINLLSARQRQQKGVIWHSMSRGGECFGTENSRRDLKLALIVGALLFFIAPFPGVLFLVSFALSRHLAAKAQQEIYNRYLDVMDAKIDSEHLERALRDGPAPQIRKVFTALFLSDSRESIAPMLLVSWLAGPLSRAAQAQCRKISGSPTLCRCPKQTCRAGDADSSQSG